MINISRFCLSFVQWKYFSQPWQREKIHMLCNTMEIISTIRNISIFPHKSKYWFWTKSQTRYNFKKYHHSNMYHIIFIFELQSLEAGKFNMKQIASQYNYLNKIQKNQLMFIRLVLCILLEVSTSLCILN